MQSVTKRLTFHFVKCSFDILVMFDEGVVARQVVLNAVVSARYNLEKAVFIDVSRIFSSIVLI